jgi:hypothetical protein
MATTTISQLPSGSVPLSGSELLEMVQPSGGLGTPTSFKVSGQKIADLGQAYTDTAIQAASASIVQTGVTIASEWRFSSATDATDPGNGKFKLNNATQNLSTAMYVDDLNRQGVDMGLLISRLNTGDIIYIQERDDSSKALLFEVSASATDNVGWWTIPLQNGQGSGESIINNKNCAFIFQYSGAPVVHSGLTGLSADDHTQYMPTDASRAFSNPVSGATPTKDAHLTTKLYTDTQSQLASANALTQANLYTDTQSQLASANALVQANLYTDTQSQLASANALTQANLYTDTQSQLASANALTQANTYSESASANALVQANKYADALPTSAADAFQLTTGLSAPNWKEGLLSWDDGDHTLRLFNDVSAMAIQVGQETILPVRNETGATIPDGTPVYLSGVTISQGKPRLLIGLAKSDNSLTLINPSVATHSIANNTDGYCTQYGFVRDIDTSGFIAGVPFGLPMNSHATSGALFVNPALLSDKTQVIVYTLPLTGVTDSTDDLTGSLRTEAAGATTTVAADWAVSNQHAFILVNSITGSGTITISGASLSESTAVPVSPDFEEIPGVSATGYYQTSKKWWEVTDIVIPGGISAINFDYGVVGYPDLGNRDFVILGYRCEAFAAGVSPDFRLIIEKIQDDGNKKMSVVIVEDIGVDSGAAGNQIVDHIRTGADERSYDPAVSSIWDNDTQIVFKQLDFNTYFSSNENRFNAEDNDEGYLIRIEGEGGGISNVDFIIIHLYFQII